ncbi:protein SIEVE ELEMENT OCCLUSION B-like [Hibiscus syriacus]|uniref:protein SIEVE ELEMENT OCCLUSION B-like n=1 Tax=Hibiscus syriacus TaxID=106335 RepID=UPI001922909E|nr:protein SIEVE ELEMENT OCCLUSION B-like [Hibiscus syriacus]
MELSSVFHGRSDPHIFSASGGKAMGKLIEATHEFAGFDISMKPVLDIVEDIFRRATPAAPGALKQVEDANDERALPYSNLDELMDVLAVTINRISCEITYRLSIGEDAHSTTLAVAQIVKGYLWDAKIVLALAAFAMTYGELLLVIQLYATNPLAKGVALLKQLPEVLARPDLLKPKFDTLAALINAMVVVAKCIVEFKELPSKYISPHDPELSSANADFPSAVYWTIRGMVVCSSQIMNLISMGHELLPSTADSWELSSLTHNINGIYDDLVEKLNLCRKRINERKDIEAFQTLVRLFEATHIDNIKILKALIYAKDDQPPLWDGTTKRRVNIEVLRRKSVLLLISDIEIPDKELLILEQIYNDSRGQTGIESQYEVIWIPIVNRSTPFDDTKMTQFESVQATMQWHSVVHPSMIQPVVIRYIKEVWGFSKKPLLVVLDPQGKVVNHNAMHMMFIWGSAAYPFTKLREEALWKGETWRIELLADSIDTNINNWLTEGKVICLYGGEDMDWIRKFTTAAKAVARAANIELEMLYMGKSNPREQVRRNMTAIKLENISHTLPDISLVWFFWARLESMWHSRAQHGMTVQNDLIMQEILTMLGFDGNDRGWAVISREADEMTRAKADTALKSLEEYKAWATASAEKGFVPALNDYIKSLQTEHHCNCLILPGISAAAIGSFNERVVCVDCGKPMEVLLMLRCCTD